MKNVICLFLKLMALVLLITVCTHCTKWDEAAVKIERFEYLDALQREPHENDSLLVEAYLIHGYHKKYDDRIQAITDRFVCDSIIPHNRFYPRSRFITFFKQSKNTNRENFRVRPKHKNIYARSNDKLFSYRVKERDSVIRIRKIFHASGPEISFQDFYCE